MNNQLTKPILRTRDKIVESARELFFAQGFATTSIADILKRSRVNSGSLYYFFRTKEQLLVAVLEKYKTMLEPMVLAPAYRRATDPIGRLFAVLEGYRRLLAATDFRLGCPIGNLALETSNSHPRIRKLVVENFEAWRTAIRELLEQARERLTPELNSDALAHFVLVTMEGSVLLARAYHNLEPFDSAVATLREYFDRLAAGSPARSAPQPSNNRKS